MSARDVIVPLQMCAIFSGPTLRFRYFGKTFDNLCNEMLAREEPFEPKLPVILCFF